VQVSREKQDVIGSLPADARAEYEHLHAVRQDPDSLSYRAADSAFTAAPDLNADFRRVGSMAAVQPTAEKDNQQPAGRAAPVYKAAPDF
jgi:hypothetical protein